MDALTSFCYLGLVPPRHETIRRFDDVAVLITNSSSQDGL